MLRRTILLIVIAVAAIALSLIWYYRAKPEETPSPAGSASQPSVPETPPPPSKIGAPSLLKTYRSDKLGFSVQYPSRYFVSNASENSEEIIVKLNKVGEEPELIQSSLDRTAHLEFIAFKNPKSQSLSELAETWGESIVGSRFDAAFACRASTIGGAEAITCSLYGSVERGSYRDIVFVRHAGKTFQFEATAPTSDDAVHSDLARILKTLAGL